MKICGLDLSMNGSGCVSFELDEKLNVVKSDFLTFTTVKKREEKNIIHYKQKDFDSFQKNNFMLKHISDFVGDSEYVAIEDYAYGSTGLVFNIAEFTGIIKNELWLNNKKLRLYDPPSIKMFATGKGNSDKTIMEKYYRKLYDIEENKNEMFDLSHLPNFKSPRADIQDAFFIAKLLQAELKLRQGFTLMQDLKEHEIRPFNRTTKANPINLLSRDFIYK